VSARFPAIDEAVCRTLCRAANDTPGREICGFLVEGSSTLTFRRIPNAGGPGEFWIDPGDLDAILNDLAKNRMEVTGFVHSHGSGLRPSASDEAAMRSSQWPWLIVVCRGSDIQGEWFWIHAGEIRSESMRRAEQ
jgi:proteasome lid subunit RPN8/RPN11